MPLADVQESIARTQKIILLYIVFDSIIISILGGFLLSRSIVRPIKDLLVATERISDRDFSQRMEGSNINEIGKLYMSFNRMPRRLKEYVESIEKTSVELKEVHKDVICSEKLAFVGRLAAGVAHEIGNPMGAILGYVHILGSGTTSKEEKKLLTGPWTLLSKQ